MPSVCPPQLRPLPGASALLEQARPRIPQRQVGDPASGLMALPGSFAGPVGAAGGRPEDLLHAVRGQPLLLHHGGADPRALLQVRGHQAHHHGPGQEQEDALRVLLRGVSLPWEGRGGPLNQAAPLGGPGGLFCPAASLRGKGVFQILLLCVEGAGRLPLNGS